MPKIVVFPFKSLVESPVGIIEIQGTATHVHHVHFLHRDAEVKSGVETDVTRICAAQLREYFEGNRKVFDVPMQQDGTDFMQQTWQQVSAIPFGKTATYLDLSKTMGDENLTRAVGTANGKNQLAILVPCHRIIGTNGKLTGYAWGLHRKQWLLDHEAKINHTFTRLF